MKYIGSTLVLIFICVMTFVWCVTPAYSITGYSRVVNKLEMYTVKNTPVRNLVKSAVTAGGGVAVGSKALRIVLGGTGWLGLGVMVGLTALELYYSSQDLNDLYSNGVGVAGWSSSAGGGPYDVNPDGNWGYGSVVINQTAHQVCGGGPTLEWSSRHVRKTAGTDETQQQFYDRLGFPVGNGWSWQQCGSPGAGFVFEYFGHSQSSQYNSTDPVFTEGGYSETSLDTWFDNNTSSPLHPDNKVQTVGVGQSPQSASSVETVSVTSSEVTSQVKPVGSITGDDIVVADNVPVPEGTQIDMTRNQTLTSTKTETVTNNPDGSVTTETSYDEDTTVTCTAGASDNRTMGSVLQGHITTWQTTGLIGSIGTLYNISFPDTLPVISVSDSFGSHEIDFGDYAWVFTALKVIIIGATSLFSVRLVFG